MPTTWLDTFTKQVLRRGTPHLPHLLAFMLDSPLHRAIAHPGQVAESLDLTGSERVLELGPGPGLFSVEIARRLTSGDGLPFPDGTFDLAFLSAVIGEVPDQAACLQSVHRVLKPGGLLVFAERFPDPDRLSVADLRGLAEPAGFDYLDASGNIWQDVVRFSRR
jgi:arsenite methyltransferase